jgi:hypothetical protein
LPPQIVRSYARIPKEIPILLIGSDLDGRMFSERATTVLLSLHGAGVLSRHKLSPEQELILRWPDKNKETDIRVVGHIGEQSGRHTYGVAFFDFNLNFWEIDFPPITGREKDLGFISLVCTSCNALEKIDEASVEADVCATNESVLRSCKRCGAATLWKPAAPIQQPAAVQQPPAIPQPAPAESAQLPLFSVPAPPQPAQAPAPSPNSQSAPRSFTTVQPAPPAPQPSFYAQLPVASSSPSNFRAGRPDLVGDVPAGLVDDPSAAPLATVLIMAPPSPDPSAPAPQNPSSAPRANRRKHPRVKVSYSACVRHPERGEDVVACEDMSKGGLRFKSSKRYYAQSLIDVAVPYQPGQPAIFVPAQIVFAEELPEQRLFRYGVQYLKLTRPRDYF